MKKSPNAKRPKNPVSIGSVTVVKTPVTGMPNTVTVTVNATGITVPYAAPAICQPVGATAFLDRLVGTIWVQESPPQTMMGDINGYQTSFGPRPAGTLRATVELNWMVTRKESKSSAAT
ncbi:MAG: hypothetical protein ACK58L_15860 [Planctomycetota bacterium]